MKKQLAIHDMSCHTGMNPHHHTRIPVKDAPSIAHSCPVIFLPPKASVIWTELQYFCSVNKSTVMPDMPDYPEADHLRAVH